MSIKTRKILPVIGLALFALVFLLRPGIASAHQPRIVEDRLTIVTEPEISKAYYAKLEGVPDIYTISSSQDFELYVGILVPDIAGQKKDITVIVLKDGNQIAILDGNSFAWTQFYEPFGADKYWKGGEYSAAAGPGKYEIRVSSTSNDSKYALAIGEIEKFGLNDSGSATTLIPQIKKDFFNQSPIGFVSSPLGLGLIAIMYILAFIFGFAYHAILKKFAKGTTRGAVRNIGTLDRLLRVAIGVGLLLWAITTSWSPVLLFFSGFAFFEAIFSWCGFYAALGKKTCPA